MKTWQFIVIALLLAACVAGIGYNIRTTRRIQVASAEEYDAPALEPAPEK